MALLDAVSVAQPAGNGRPCTRLDHLIVDKAYGSRANRRSLRARRIPHTLPERDDVLVGRTRRGARGGRPRVFDAVRYKDRNQIARAFSRFKQFRAVATRYDKLRDRYHATVTITSIMIWLRAKPD